MYCIVVYWIVLLVLYCITLYCSALDCIVLYYILFSQWYDIILCDLLMYGVADGPKDGRIDGRTDGWIDGCVRMRACLVNSSWLFIFVRNFFQDENAGVRPVGSQKETKDAERPSNTHNRLRSTISEQILRHLALAGLQVWNVLQADFLSWTGCKRETSVTSCRFQKKIAMFEHSWFMVRSPRQTAWRRSKTWCWAVSRQSEWEIAWNYSLILDHFSSEICAFEV